MPHVFFHAETILAEVELVAAILGRINSVFFQQLAQGSALFLRSIGRLGHNAFRAGYEPGKIAFGWSTGWESVESSLKTLRSMFQTR